MSNKRRKSSNPPHVFGKLVIPPKVRITGGGLVRSGPAKVEGVWPEDPDEGPEVEPEYKKVKA